MTVNTNYAGNIRKPLSKTLSGTSSEAVGDVAADRTQTVASWSFVNPTGGAVTCSLYWNDGTNDILWWRKSVASQDTQIESNMPIRLETGNSIKAMGSSGIIVNIVYSLAYQVT